MGKSTAMRLRRKVAAGLMMLALCVAGVLCVLRLMHPGESMNRRRLTSANATNFTVCRSHSSIGLDLTIQHDSQAIRVAGGFIVVLYCFLGLAVVCDEFFQPALEEISDALALSPDVAGATFLAAGSSAPELFTSFGDTFGPSNNIGVGTIVGSAMFNILVIVALSAAAADEQLTVDWRPVYRDVAFYVLSVTLFMVFAADERVQWYEGLSMVLCYVGYIVLMKFNAQLFFACDNTLAMIRHQSIAENATDQNNAAELKLAPPTEPKAGGEQRNPMYDNGNTMQDVSSTEQQDEDGNEQDVSRFDWPSTFVDQILFTLSLPWLLVFTLTTPDVSDERWRKWYAVAFGMSIVWIGTLCYCMVEQASQIGCELKVHPVVMGVLVLSIGTSVPDAIGSILAAKRGEADMAVANAIGSNVFDILLGLGLPWFCVTVSSEKQFVKIDVAAMKSSVIILLSTVVLFLTSLQLSQWKMNARLGKILLVVYVAYIIYTIVDAVYNPAHPHDARHK